MAIGRSSYISLYFLSPNTSKPKYYREFNNNSVGHMNSIDYVAKILKQEGVEWMPLYPSNPLIEAVAKEGKSF